MTSDDSQTTAVLPLLEEDFGFAIGIVFRAYAKALEAVVVDLPAGIRGYFILAAAVRREARSQRFLASRLGVDRTMMTYLLDDLEEAGLVERKPDPVDRRSRQILSTPAGEKVYAALHAKVLEIDQQIISALPEESQAAFSEMVYAIAREVTVTEAAAEQESESAAKKKPTSAPRRRQPRPNV
ncbi:MarR family winged helix-turn-helix transcriptional regulator [Actinacidiphila glaucinigra]|uniref:MarR family winged helix-turn-helix transcriptional regulator n=1 Tax=Actinacidiphila glaucinigra TaxID=235986 RepID=UPI002E328AB2|nr:MarR family transcriptional regulator [Actinacidiphila glaucinigra]